MKVNKEDWIRIELTNLDEDSRKELGEWVAKNRPARRLYTKYYLWGVFVISSIKKEVDL